MPHTLDHTQRQGGNMHELKFTVRQAYGNTRYYPDCDRSTRILNMFKVKSLTPEQLLTFGEALGVKVTIIMIMPSGERIEREG